MRRPRSFYNRTALFSRARRALAQKHQGEPPVEAVALAAGIDPRKHAANATPVPAEVSLDHPMLDGDDRSYALSDVIRDPKADNPAAVSDSAVVAANVRRAVGTLTPQQARMLTLRFGLDGDAPRTFAAIGKAVGLSKARVHQVVQQGLSGLRRHRDIRAHAPT